MVNVAQQSDSVLVIVDIQQRLASAMDSAERESLIKHVSVLIQAANALAIPVLVTEQYPKGLGSTEIDLKEVLLETAPVIEKTCFSCLKSELFTEKLKALQKKQVILVGMESHICIMQTALDLLGNDYSVFVVEDGVCSRTESNKTNALHRLRQQGVIISNTESVLFEWLGDAKHPEFRALSKLIV